MNLPDFIRLGGHKIAIVRRELGDEAYGIFDSEALTITLDSTLTGSILVESFCHELVECLNFFAEAEMEHKSVQVFGLLLGQAISSILGQEEGQSGVN